MLNKKIDLQPLDEYNKKLISYVHPPNWVNPTPQEKYDLVVIGAGTAGLVVAAGTAGLVVAAGVAVLEGKKKIFAKKETGKSLETITGKGKEKEGMKMERKKRRKKKDY